MTKFSRLSLGVTPCKREAHPSVIAYPDSALAGLHLPLQEQIEYQLPEGDRLVLMLDYQHNQPHLILFTHDPQKLRLLPGHRPSSLVAETIAGLHQYRHRANHYAKPRTPAQNRKYQLVDETIKKLLPLLADERALQATDFRGQEALRRKVIRLIESLRDENRLLANHPLVSEGFLGKHLYDLKQEIQHFEFNQLRPVSLLDQGDYSNSSPGSCFVWDSEMHLGHDARAIETALQEICRLYRLNYLPQWRQQSGSRLGQVWLKAKNLWSRLQELANDWAAKPEKEASLLRHSYDNALIINRLEGSTEFTGLEQRSFESPADLVSQYLDPVRKPLTAREGQTVKNLVAKADADAWGYDEARQMIYLKKNNEFIKIRYFSYPSEFGPERYVPLPDAADLFKLYQLKSNPLSLTERLLLKLQSMITSLPHYLENLVHQLHHFVVTDLYLHFKHHVQRGHVDSRTAIQAHQEPRKINLEHYLRQKQILAMGQSLTDYIQEHLAQNQLSMADPRYPDFPLHYTDPLHRSVSVLKHFADFFVDISERNPIAGTLALAAYIYGGAVVIAPNTMTALLVKLHLNGLIATIKPAQYLGQLMGHGALSEGVSTAVTLWQAIIVGGNLDTFFINAIELVQDNPAEIALLASLALALGFGLCQGVPAFRHEMGIFPLPNYMATGAKAGAAIADTTYHPGKDWFFGTLKWLLQAGLRLSEILLAPLIEVMAYGPKKGFLPALKKSLGLIWKSIKQLLAGSVDLVLVLLNVFLQEIPGLLIHVPFRGITNLIARVLSTLANLEAIARACEDFGDQCKDQRFFSGFRLSPLYGLPRYEFQGKWYRHLPGIISHYSLHLLKNALLPIGDLLSLAGRGILQGASLGLGYGCKWLGALAAKPGGIIDKLPGKILQLVADWLIKIANWVDFAAGWTKQWLLSQIHVIRSKLFHWAFTSEQTKVSEDESVYEPASTHQMMRRLAYSRPEIFTHLTGSPPAVAESPLPETLTGSADSGPAAEVTATSNPPTFPLADLLAPQLSPAAPGCLR